MLLMAALLPAQQIFYELTPTLEWEPVVTDSNGDPFLAGDTVEYQVYTWDMAQGDITLQDVSTLRLIGTTDQTALQLSFPYRTEWAAAVRTKHTDAGGTVTYSPLAYSTVEADVASSPFWYSPVLIWLPARPGGLRDSGI